MSSADELKAKIAETLLKVEQELEEHRRAIRMEMTVREKRLNRAQELIHDLMEGIVMPNLKALSESFPASLAPQWDGSSGAASVTIGRTEEFPVSAGIDVSITADPGVTRLVATFKVSILPILMDYAREGSLDVDIDHPDTAKLEEFLELRILRFARDYVAILRPDSPYQKDRQVTDPYCGMTFLIQEAAATLKRDGQTYYFCTEECRERFEAGHAD